MDDLGLEQEYGSEVLLQQHSRQPCLLSIRGQVLLLLPGFATMRDTFSFCHPNLRSAIPFQPCHVLWDRPGTIQVDVYQLGVDRLVELVLQVVVFDARDGSAIRAKLLLVLRHLF